MRREFGEEAVQAKMYGVIFPKTDDKVQKNWGKDIFLFPQGVWQRSMAECSRRRMLFHLAPGALGVF